MKIFCRIVKFSLNHNTLILLAVLSAWLCYGVLRLLLKLRQWTWKGSASRFSKPPLSHGLEIIAEVIRIIFSFFSYYFNWHQFTYGSQDTRQEWRVLWRCSYICHQLYLINWASHYTSPCLIFPISETTSAKLNSATLLNVFWNRWGKHIKPCSVKREMC